MIDMPTNDRSADRPNDETPTMCGDARELQTTHGPIGVACTRAANHDEDHFDEQAGIGWFSEGSSPAGLTPEERAHGILDRLGVPRGRNEHTWTLHQRLNLFVDRLGKRLSEQVERNMVYYNTVNDALVLLEGSPNSSQFRVKAAIQKLRDVQPQRRTASGLHLQ